MGKYFVESNRKFVLTYNGKFVMKNKFSKIIYYLRTKNAISVDDEKYWVDMGNDYKVDMCLRTKTILHDFNKIVKQGYELKEV